MTTVNKPYRHLQSICRYMLNKNHYTEISLVCVSGVFLNVFFSVLYLQGISVWHYFLRRGMERQICCNCCECQKKNAETHRSRGLPLNLLNNLCCLFNSVVNNTSYMATHNSGYNFTKQISLRPRPQNRKQNTQKKISNSYPKICTSPLILHFPNGVQENRKPIKDCLGCLSFK